MNRYFLRVGITAAVALLLYVSANASEYIEEEPPLHISEIWPDNNVFQEHYYYEEDKLERYKSYQAENPELPTGDVVWMVNSMLDGPFYGEIKEIEDLSVFPLLVNKYNKLPENYVPENLEKLPSGRAATAETKEAFTQMVSDAYSQGFYIREVSAFRSYETQRALYNRYLSRDTKRSVDTYSARPGFSEHQTGRAIDLCARDGVMNRFGRSKEYEWVVENGHEYGFIIRYPKDMSYITGYMYEPWHITYIGKEAASIMRENGIKTLEEYMVKYVYHTPS